MEKRRIITIATAALMAFALVFAFAAPVAVAWWIDPNIPDDELEFPEETPDWWVEGPDGESVPAPATWMHPGWGLPGEGWELPDGWGATAQEVIPQLTTPLLGRDALLEVHVRSRNITVEPIIINGQTVTLGGGPSGWSPITAHDLDAIQSMQSSLHNLVARGEIPDGSELMGSFSIARSGLDQDGNWVNLWNEEVTLTFNVPDVPDGDFVFLYYFPVFGQDPWHKIPVTVSNGQFSVTLPGINSHGGLIRLISVPTPAPGPSVLGAATAPATGE